MDEGEIKTRVRAIIAEIAECHINDLDDDMALEAVGMNSLDIVELSFIIDERLKFPEQPTDDEIRAWETVDNVISYCVLRLCTTK